MKLTSKYWFLVLVLLVCQQLNAQNLPLGTWRAFVPLANVVSITQSNQQIYCATEYGVFSYDVDNSLIETYTKTDGLSEVEPSKVAYNTLHSCLIIGYKNSNIDIIQNGKITNLPYLKNATIIADKTINAIFTQEDFAFVATGFGVLQIDLTKKEIKATYNFTNGISTLSCTGVFADNQFLYVSTNNGVYQTSFSNPTILDFNTWQKISSGVTDGNSSNIVKYDNKIWISKNNQIYNYNNNNWTLAFSETNWQTVNMSVNSNHLLIAQHKIVSGNLVESRIGKWENNTFTFLPNTSSTRYPIGVIEDKNGAIWHGDLYDGLIRHTPNFQRIFPNGPSSITNRAMNFMNNTLYVASSSISSNNNPTFNKNGVYIYKDGTWSSLNQYNYPVFDSIYDITVAEPLDAEQKVFFGGNNPGGGIVEFNVTNNTSTVPVVYRPFSNQKFRLTNATVDFDNNVWFTDAYSSFPIICRKPDGSFKYFQSPYLNNTIVKDIIADDFGQLWIAKNAASGGLVVFNHNNTIDNTSDDIFVNYAAGETAGNLPSNDVWCLAKDADGDIWLGTSRGIAVIRCASQAIDMSCPAEQICVDRNDNSNFCDNLLENQIVTCIEVDAANRKWIGTTNGIYLVSATGEEQIHYFNTTNSPLLGNDIRSIAINKSTGDIYIGTDKGINAFRETATERVDNNEKAFVYPNPVLPNYDGLIAMKNLPENSSVKITDAVGNLVYQTTATGSQATWDGKLIDGKRAASGVYLVLCKGEGKKEKLATKFVLLH